MPAAYNTQINDVLLTALARAWCQATGSPQLFTNLEGHGREPLFDDVDVSRTMGWFTSIFPVRIELPAAKDNWEPGAALRAVKEQLRRIPRRGIGYGILRYLGADSDLSQRAEPSIVFNYLGRFDQIGSDSKIFRLVSPSLQGWHSPRQRRRHILEINGLIVDGRLELWWTYSENLQAGTAIAALAEQYMAALRQLIVHCTSAKRIGNTPSDFPLVRLDQPALDALAAQYRNRRHLPPLADSAPVSLGASKCPGSTSSTCGIARCTGI